MRAVASIFKLKRIAQVQLRSHENSGSRSISGMIRDWLMATRRSASESAEQLSCSDQGVTCSTEKSPLVYGQFRIQGRVGEESAGAKYSKRVKSISV